MLNEKDKSSWLFTDNARMEENTLTLPDEGSRVILKNGEYKDFVLSMKVLTTPGAKGAIYFHTDDKLDKGYRVVLNNDNDDPIWWKKTGSLEYVRNLTKSFVRDNEWFDLRITVRGESVGVDINGEPVVEYVEPEVPYRIEKYKNMRLSEGTFAIVNESSKEILCRDIEIGVPQSPAETSSHAKAINEQKDEIIRLHQEDFPVLDYHVHLKGGLTKERAAEQSRELGINYVVAPNCGIGFPISTNEQIRAFLDTMRTQPFILAMQAEGREWLTAFSPEMCREFDFVFTDALTFTDNKGRRTYLWIPEQVWIEGDEEKYMDLILDRICSVLQEPADVYVNPCFLPEPMDKRYDELWTEERMNIFIDALAKSGKALEINELYQIPSKAIIMKAKDAGVKFTFGSNNITPEVSDLSYCIRMKKECGLTAKDMYKPKIKL